MEKLTFNDELLKRRPPTGIDIVTTLAHFAIITYLVDPQVAQRHVHPRFELDLVEVDGRQWGLLSVVPFIDQDFRFSRFPWFKWRFGQTNYRLYVTDRETGRHVVWFYGTSLDSLTVTVPRYLWNLPWHRASIDFDCHFDTAAQRYSHYRMSATRSWANAHVALADSGEPAKELLGFDDLETGLVLLTHPREGFYYRRDGRLGSYAIWHDRLETTAGQVTAARFDLLDELGLVNSGDTSPVHSVLLQHQTEFTIYLPPKPVD